MERQPRSAKSTPLKIAMRTADDYQWCAAKLKALADPDRLKIVSCLFSGPKNVSQLSAQLGEDMVKVSHHLGVLRHAGVVRSEKAGKYVIYQLDPEIAAQTKGDVETLDLGCCRLDLPKPGKKGASKMG